MFTATTATHKILDMHTNMRLVAGGTSASKTISILQILIDTAQSKRDLLIDVVSETMPHMRGGAMLDFETIMKTHDYWEDDCWNATLCIYTFPGTRSRIHFFSADASSKAHGPRRDILFINEGNNIPWPIADHLIVRTRSIVWVDWNPSSEFWAYTEIMDNPAYTDQFDFITLTYIDNEALDEVTIKRIEAHKSNVMWWKVYGLGQLGEIEGRIFTGWRWLDEIPFEARLAKRGLDFGYTNDPTGILDVYEYNGGFIFDEQCYEYGMRNKAIADLVKSLDKPNTLVVADSSEPKSIDEIRSLGVNIIGANKGKDSINQGISYMQGQPISATKRSINLKKEYERYIWLKDRLTDKFINEAPDVDNHLLDPARYALESYHQKTRGGQVIHTAGSNRTRPPSTIVSNDGKMMLNLDFRRAYGKKRRTIR